MVIIDTSTHRFQARSRKIKRQKILAILTFLKNDTATLYTKLHEIESTVTVIIHPHSKVDDEVNAGTLLGIVSDYLGEPAGTAYAG